MLAGISADYYLRLEQGRDRNPSVQVLEALAAVLRLDADTTAHLIGLASPRPTHGRPEQPVPPSVLELISTWSTNPAYVQNKFTDILAANPLATAITPNYSPGTNMMRAVFTDPAERALRRDWLGRPPRRVWRACATTWGPTWTIPGWWSWWTSFPHVVTGSGSCGHARTSSPAVAGWSG
jgi:transcriptional regulator with XRE-family HTH domain